MEELGYLVLALLTSAVGALGGLGGAVLLVPALSVLGVPIADAAPLGLLSVAALSIGAGGRQVAERAVNHRLGVAMEVAASAGGVAGALASGSIGERPLVYGLAAVALLAALAGSRRTGLRNPVDPAAGPGDVGERIGSIAGAYPLDEGVAPYRPQRVPAGVGLMLLAGGIAGLSGTSGGFVKTPTMSEVMHVPTRVAAATTTFTIGVTSAAALLVMAAQDRIDPHLGAAVVAGALVGGRLGATLQARLQPPRVRRFLSIALVLVAAVLVATA